MNRQRFRADDPERRERQNSEKILSAIGLTEGMTFVDVGCGEGYFAIPAARRVGENGRVYAVNISAGAVAGLREHAVAGGLKNLSAEVKERRDRRLQRLC
jgi:cyclopropane fatty-acyl-phospholipid synthase-like methyltransferase